MGPVGRCILVVYGRVCGCLLQIEMPEAVGGWVIGADSGTSRRGAGLLYSISDTHGILVSFAGPKEGVRDEQMS